MVPLCYRCISGLNLKCCTVILHAVLSIFFILSGFCRDDSKEEICGPAPVVMIWRRAQFWNSCRKLSNSARPESFQQNLILLTNNTSIMWGCHSERTGWSLISNAHEIVLQNIMFINYSGQNTNLWKFFIIVFNFIQIRLDTLIKCIK